MQFNKNSARSTVDDTLSITNHSFVSARTIYSNPFCLAVSERIEGLSRIKDPFNDQNPFTVFVAYIVIWLLRKKDIATGAFQN